MSAQEKFESLFVSKKELARRAAEEFNRRKQAIEESVPTKKLPKRFIDMDLDTMVKFTNQRAFIIN